MDALIEARGLGVRIAGRAVLDHVDLAVTPGEIALRQQLADTRIPGLTIEDEESLITVVEAVPVEHLPCGG